MFRHKGKGRTYSHNLKLASILSTVAGIINITGVLAVHVLTTNVTGHFAFFSEQLSLKNYTAAFTYLYYILFFLLGAFISGLIAESTARSKSHISYSIPITIEILIMLSISLSSFLFNTGQQSFSIVISPVLLFAMGLQNALVTRVSQSVVRTTHLTGLFTDLGIELSQLFFYKERSERIQLNKSIFLKLMIIGCFFLGSMIGGLGYRYFELKTLFIPVFFLLFALWYERLLFRFYHLKRRFSHPE
ncbi:YoaK family protein [Chryseobacterium indoltheticum]|uniref:Predicted membrane protein n=1 Tax=Chryseobacterium indoltheticum TaxID=254 RepID=A0A381FQV2_9FLAO|nr:YoaK family protein [Chryseobacterium indoltheticum]SUX48755.1 Predicted membrane protein [Chryseobacterium indoltheticum]